MNKHYSITVRGKCKEWCFDIHANPEYVDEWRKDGLVIDEVVNEIPARIADWGFVREWCFLQDISKFIFGG